MHSGEERRKNEINIQYYMEVLVKDVKELFSTKVDTINTRINSLEEKVVTQLVNHEQQSEEKLKYFEQEIGNLKTDIKDIDKRVEELEIKPTKTKAAWIDTFWSVFRKVLYTAIATGVLGFLIFLIKQYCLI